MHTREPACPLVTCSVKEDEMSWSPEMRQHRMRNYRLMFRGAFVCLAISVVMTLIGGLRVLVDSQLEWLGYGLLMFVWSAGSMYLTVDSTVRIIEVETEEARPRSEY